MTMSSSKICVVCGDKALGLNFSAITCESCKAFFRRNALLKKKLLCPFNQNCDITIITRRFCQKCRLDKCFNAGMNKDHIMSDEDKKLKKHKIEENRVKRKQTKCRKLDNDDIPTEECDRISTTNINTTNSIIDNNEDSKSYTTNIDYHNTMSVSSVESQERTTDTNSNTSKCDLLTTLSTSEIVQTIVDNPENSSNAINSFMKTPSEALNLIENIINSQKDAMKLIGHLILYPGDALKIISKIMNSPFDALTVFTKFMSSPKDSIEIISKIVNSPADVLKFMQQLMSSPGDAIDIMNKFMETPEEALKIINKMVNSDLTVETKHSNFLNDFNNDTTSSSNSFTMISNITVDKKNESYSADISKQTQVEENEFSKCIESILCDAIKLEYELNDPIVAQNTCNNMKLSEIEATKLIELKSASLALLNPVDIDLSNSLDSERIKCEKNSQDPQLLKVINLTAVAIRRLIKMSKKINAFRNMCQEDQIALLKGGCIEMMIMRSVMSYDCDHATWKIPHSQEDMSNIRVDVLKLAEGNVYEEHDRFIQTFDPKWRKDENIILIMCAIVLFTPFRPRVIHADVIKLEQNSYYYLLRRYLQSIYQGCEAKSTFLKLIQKISEVEKLNTSIIGVYLNVNPSHIEPLLREIFDLKNY